MTEINRRIFFQGLGALGVAAALAGCGPSAETSAPAAASGTELAKTADIPVGGGVVLTDQKIVITQPKQGEFKAFSAVCTHQGNLVSLVADDTITCTVHNSTYSAETGVNESGPAPSPLAAVPIKVDGDRILSA